MEKKEGGGEGKCKKEMRRKMEEGEEKRKIKREKEAEEKRKKIKGGGRDKGR